MSTHGPIEDKYREGMNAFAEALDETITELFGERLCFALFLYKFGEPVEGRVNYISNGAREDMLCALKEVVARMEGMDV